MENHNFSWVNPLFLMAIFNSYVSLPEGNSEKSKCVPFLVHKNPGAPRANLFLGASEGC
jgi:hypothetical protein